VDYLRLQKLSYELGEFWRRIHGFYLDAVAGFSFVHSRIEQDQARIRQLIDDIEISSETFQDTRMFSYSMVFSKEFCGSGIHHATQGEVKSRNRPGGMNYIILGQLCVVSFFDYWNDYLRKEYAIAKGALNSQENDQKKIDMILADHARDDFWGDMRHLRNSIVHNGGIANSDIAKCKLITWFSPKQEINLTPVMMRSVFLAVLQSRNKIFSEGLPPRTLRIKEYTGNEEPEDKFIG